MKRISVLLALCSCLWLPSAWSDSIHEILRQRVELLMYDSELQVAGEVILTRDLLPKLYAAVDYEPLWRNRSTIEQLDSLAELAHQEGLDRKDYPLGTIAALLPLSGLPEDDYARAELDILATETLLRIGYQLRFGKVNPYELFPNWNFDRELLPGVDPVDTLRSIISSDSLRDSVSDLIARGPYYQSIVDTLTDHRAISAAGGWPEVPEGPTLRVDDQGLRVAALRQRLAASGDLASPDIESRTFDSELARAVIAFQQRHGLDDDGVVGKQTIAALNVPVEDRIRQIRGTLERGRWVFEDIRASENEMIMVNIASAEVNLIRGLEFVWTSRVQVGKNYRQTPVFKDELEYLVFNPTWTVPPTILRQDVVPKLLADPAGYLTQKNMDLLDRDGRIVDLETVDFSTLGPRNFPYIVRQRPGPWNALGMVKFIFPNPHFVFLHDTPSRELFERADRAFSSGCVRVQDPFVFAELLFNEPDKWNQVAFQEILDSKQIRTVHLKKPIPVFLLYLTADVDGAGRPRFFDDIYGRDEVLLNALDAAPQIEVPVAG
jgi:murein L,D-transpeptidase YcbB/YkuD